MCEAGKLIPVGGLDTALEVSTLFVKCGENNSLAGIDLGRRLVRKHPKSGLANYLLFNTIACFAKQGEVSPELKAEALAAHQAAVEYGCSYVLPGEDGVQFKAFLET